MNDPLHYRDSLRCNDVSTWMRALAAAVLLDPAALRRSPHTTTETIPAATTPTALTVAEVAAAALIEGGYDESAFLLLALADPTPRAATRGHSGRTHTARPRRSTSRLLR